MLASVPLVPKFAPEVTATVCELRNRDTSRLRGNAKMASITVQSHLVLERVLSIEIVRVTERAAVSAARLRGHGKDKASDQAAVDAMRRELNKLPIDGTVVIGEGELDIGHGGRGHAAACARLLHAEDRDRAGLSEGDHRPRCAA